MAAAKFQATRTGLRSRIISRISADLDTTAAFVAERPVTSHTDPAVLTVTDATRTENR